MNWFLEHRKIVGLMLLIATVAAVAYVVRVQSSMADFEVYYTAGKRFVNAEPLYRMSDGHYQYKYPPISALFFSPFALLPLMWAKALWYCISVLCLWATLMVCDGLTAGKRNKTALILTTLIMAKFYGHELVLGQVNLVYILLLLIMLRLALRDRPSATGGLLGLAALIKPYALIFIPYWLIRKEWRALTAGLVVFAGGVVAPAIRYGMQGNFQLLSSWRETLTLTAPETLGSADNVSLFGLVAKWGGGPWDGSYYGLSFFLIAILASIVGLFLVRRSGQVSPQQVVAEAAVLLVCIPLITPSGWDYTFLSGTLGTMMIIKNFHIFHSWEKTLLIVNFVLIGATIYDLMGRTIYHFFMFNSVLTICFLLMIYFLLILHHRLAD